MKNMRNKICLLAVVFSSIWAGSAQERQVSYENRVDYRTEFGSYTSRESSSALKLDGERFYMDLTDKLVPVRRGEGLYYVIDEVEIPMIWLDRDIYLHTEGSRNGHRLYVNTKYAGSARDERVPSEFNVSSLMVDGTNNFVIECVEDSRKPADRNPDSRERVERVWLHAQPRMSIFDVRVEAVPDSTGKRGLLRLDVIINSSYNYEEPIDVCYDIYSPENELKYYDVRETAVAGGVRDTIHFETTFPGAVERQWSATSPYLYKLTVFLRQEKRITEYTTFYIGFGKTEWRDGEILRNEKPITITAARWEGKSTEAESRTAIRALKGRGINTLYLAWPQPEWFYSLCDREGIYVVDRANIHTDGSSRKVGASTVNDPEWLDEYLHRVQAMYFRSQLHPSVIAYSLGEASGNGYNMYKTYQWLKEQGDSRPVVYDSEGEWNSDLVLPAPIE